MSRFHAPLIVLQIVCGASSLAFAQSEPFAFPPAESLPEVFTPAPEQHPPHLFLPAHPSMYTELDPHDVFEGNFEPEPDILPEEAYLAPPTDTESGPLGEGPLRVAQYPFQDSSSQGMVADEDVAPTQRWNPAYIGQPPLPPTPSVSRGWVWQDHRLTTTILPAGGSDFGITTFDLRTTLFSEVLPIVRLKPRMTWHYLSGPTRDSGRRNALPDMPARVYEVSVDFMLYLPINSYWSFLGNIEPGFYTDFQNTTGDAFRVPTRAFFLYRWNERIKAMLGLIYLDRKETAWVPGVGLIITPHEDLKIDLLFPNPKVAWRTYADQELEHWWYLAGEFYSGTWAIERARGAGVVNDIATYRDLRLVCGFEQRSVDGGKWFGEVAYVFDREIQYDRFRDFQFSSTAMVRAGLTF